MSINRLSKHVFIFILAFILGLSNFALAQEKMDKKSSKDLKETTLKITGITWGGCAKKVQDALESVDGVEKVSVSFKEKNAVVIFNAEKATIEQFNKIVPQKAGSQFKVTEHSEPKTWKTESKKSDEKKIK